MERRILILKIAVYFNDVRNNCPSVFAPDYTW